MEQASEKRANSQLPKLNKLIGCLIQFKFTALELLPFPPSVKRNRFNNFYLSF